MKLVIIGGGTGLSTLLRGIKYINDIEISAIVSIADDGGSTGILSHHFSIPAVGDLRKVIGSLSKERNYLENLLEFRFKDSNTDLDGHSIGNLIITSEIIRTKSFSQGIANISKMLNVEGAIIPVSDKKSILCAQFFDGTLAKGESEIRNQNKKIKSIFYDNKSIGSKIATNAIADADIIILGIGSLYTSIIPNLIFPNIVDALKSTQAKVYYFCNIVTEVGETNDMSIMDHVNAIEEHTFKNLIDTIIISNSKIPQHAIDDYKNHGQSILNDDTHGKIKTMYADLIRVDNESLRHSEKLIENVVKKIIQCHLQ